MLAQIEYPAKYADESSSQALFSCVAQISSSVDRIETTPTKIKRPMSSARRRYLLHALVAHHRWIHGHENASRLDLSYMSFGQINLRGRNFSNGCLDHADFSGACFIEANFRAVTASSANFTGADFTGADLSYVDFSHADLRGANFTGANLHGADFWRANLHGATISPLQLHSVLFCRKGN